VLRAARKCSTQKIAKKSPSMGTIVQLCRAISSQLRHILTIGKKTVKHQYLSHMPTQYGKLRSTSGWGLLASLGHPCKFQRVARLGSVTARQSSSGRQPNFAALNRGCHLYSAGRPSRWVLAHISSYGRPAQQMRTLYFGFYLSSSFFPRLISAVGNWTSTILNSTHGVALVRI